MKTSTTRFMLIVLLAATAVAAAPEATVPAPAWKAVAASGGVEALPAGAQEADWSRVTRGDLVAPLAAVRTGARGRATFVGAASVIVVDPQSRLVLPAVAGDGTAVRQEIGSAIYEIDGSRQKDFRVETPFLVAGVKGTVFLVAVTENGAAVTVREGTVEVLARQSGERVEVHAGETVLVDDALDPQLRVVPAPDAPRDELRAADRESRRVAWLHSRRLDQAVSDRRFTLREALRKGEDPDVVRTASRLLTATTDIARADSASAATLNALLDGSVSTESDPTRGDVGDVGNIGEVVDDAIDAIDDAIREEVGDPTDPIEATEQLIEDLLGGGATASESETETSGDTGTTFPN